MIDVEAGLLALMNDGEREVELSVTDTHAIRVLVIPVAARFAKSAGVGPTLEDAMLEAARKINQYGVRVELPLALDETLCESCGLTLDRVNGVWLMHPECEGVQA